MAISSFVRYLIYKYDYSVFFFLGRTEETGAIRAPVSHQFLHDSTVLLQLKEVVHDSEIFRTHRLPADVHVQFRMIPKRPPRLTFAACCRL